MYAKIFDSMYDGTLYGHWEAIVTLQQMLVLCDPAGVIDMTPEAIAGKTSIPVDIIRKGIEVLTSPDPGSRTPGEEGRRIATIDQHRPWGWYIINHAKYQKLKSVEEKREADRQRIAEKRNKNKPVATCRSESQHVADVAHSDSDVYADKDLGGTPPPPPVSGGAKAPPAQDLFKAPPPKSTPKAKHEAPTSETWTAYGSAYLRRYGVEPVRNRTVNGQLAQFVSRVGAGPAPSVAAFYVESNRGLYVSAKHPINLLLRDAEGLHTEWATGQHGTETQARQADKTAANGNVFSKLILEARAAKNGT